MKKQAVLDILRAVEAGALSADDALLKLKMEPFEDMGFAKVDFHRDVRQGTPEVIFGAGKTPGQIAAIASRMLERGEGSVLITRVTKETAD